MTGVIDFYFDFISPFSYLAHCRLPDIAARHGREIAYHVSGYEPLGASLR